jgi:cyclopropane fatty-acyl-phospholipid synthase-like methyltransferase
MPLFLCSSKLLVELPCKDGSAGLYLASRTKCQLLGLDTSPAAIAIATRRAQALGLAATSRHQAVGNLSDTGLQSGTADAVLSCDELWLAADQGAVLKVGGSGE